MVDLKERQAYEMVLWKDYMAGDKKAMNKLMKSYKPLMMREVNKWSSASVPKKVLEVDAKIILKGALPKFNPDRGVKLNTYLTGQLRKLSRTAYSYGPSMYIPEHRQRRIKMFKDVFASLESRFGREPNIQELSEELIWSPDDVGKMIKEISPTHLFGEFTPDISYMPQDEASSMLRYVYHDLSSEEKLVLEHQLGLNGKAKLKSMKEISRKTGLEYNQVRMLQESVTKKIGRGAELFLNIGN